MRPRLPESGHPCAWGLAVHRGECPHEGGVVPPIPEVEAVVVHPLEELGQQRAAVSLQVVEELRVVRSVDGAHHA